MVTKSKKQVINDAIASIPKGEVVTVSNVLDILNRNKYCYFSYSIVTRYMQMSNDLKYLGRIKGFGRYEKI